MEPMNYALEGRGLLFPDYNIPTFASSRNILKDWNLNPFSDVDNNMFGSSQEITVDIVKKCTTSNRLSGGLGAETVDVSTSIITLDQILGEVEFEARFSHTGNRSNDPISSPIRLKLEQLIDHGEFRSSRSLLPTEKTRSHFPVCQVHGHREEDSIVYREIKSNSSSMENSDSLLLGKGMRTTNLYSQVPLCKVYGCNKDLSSSKRYHKRHRVCDEHSKTAKVIVNGIEQRFCQQCSRFHLLAEFDEDKRSCRKRLAGHNERRRKPQFDTPWGSRLLGMTSESRVPFLFPVIHHGSSFCQEKYEKHSKHIKLERSPTKSLEHHHIMRKENSSKIHPGATQSVQELSAGQNSAGALSLLSVHSQRHLRGTDRIIQVLDDGQAVSSEVQRERSNSTTVDLVQLSSHLQRVEQLKKSIKVKQENETFSCFNTT